MMLDFLQSRTFITHVTGLLGILATAYGAPNSPLFSFAVAVLTGVTQAAHAYQNGAKPVVTAMPDFTAPTGTRLYNAAGTEPVHTVGPLR